MTDKVVLMTHFLMEAPPPSIPPETMAQGLSEGLGVRAVKPTHEQIKRELERIGDGWHLRDEHVNPDRVEKTRALLEGTKTSAWQFTQNGKPIGFCVAVKGGFCGEHTRISERFNLHSRRGAEIYKVGLYPEYTGRGYGHIFLPTVQIALLNGQEGVKDQDIRSITPNEFIYLNTRETNRINSVPFYKSLGYDWAGEERFPLTTHDIRGLKESADTELPAKPPVKRRLVPAAALPLVAGPRAALG